jgi:hypothetical protein
MAQNTQTILRLAELSFSTLADRPGIYVQQSKGPLKQSVDTVNLIVTTRPSFFVY